MYSHKSKYVTSRIFQYSAKDTQYPTQWTGSSVATQTLWTL